MNINVMSSGYGDSMYQKSGKSKHRQSHLCMVYYGKFLSFLAPDIITG